VGELIGYARCSTVLQDLTVQRQALAALGVPDDRIYLDKGLTGTSRGRPGLDQVEQRYRRLHLRSGVAKHRLVQHESR
jgi:DNA invertase Pin-like site-specific DNA recombinase